MQKKTHAVNPFYCGLTVHRYTEYSKKITKHLRAALITDLHSTIYGSAQEPLRPCKVTGPTWFSWQAILLITKSPTKGLYCF